MRRFSASGSTIRRLRTGAGSAWISSISSSTYLSFRRAGQPAYSVRQVELGVSQTAKVSAKSSVGWLWAYQCPRCST